MNNDLTVAIPTFNSGRYIDIILGFYREHGVPVTVFVDDRSVDDTFEKAKPLAAEVISISNPVAFIPETIIAPLSGKCQTKWVLRIDDDELPSLAMLRFVQAAVRGETAAVFAFERHQCAVSREGQLLRHRKISSHDHRQWRLYQPSRVRFTHQVHTPTFEWDDPSREAPAGATMIHLDWVLHSYNERLEKMRHYDRHGSNAGTQWRAYYLYEETALDGALATLSMPEFKNIALEIARRFPDLCHKL